MNELQEIVDWMSAALENGWREAIPGVVVNGNMLAISAYNIILSIWYVPVDDIGPTLLHRFSASTGNLQNLKDWVF